MDARLPNEANAVTMADIRLGRKRAEPSTLRTVAALIRETDPSLWEILQSVMLHDITIGRLLEEAKHLRITQTASSQSDGAFPFHKYLTERESQVADLVAQGESNKEIGQRLELSAKTVKNHVSNILRKLALQRRTQIAILALRERTKA